MSNISPWTADPDISTGLSFPRPQHFSLPFSLILYPFSMFVLCLTLLKPRALT